MNIYIKTRLLTLCLYKGVECRQPSCLLLVHLNGNCKRRSLRRPSVVRFVFISRKQSGHSAVSKLQRWVLSTGDGRSLLITPLLWRELNKRPWNTWKCAIIPKVRSCGSALYRSSNIIVLLLLLLLVHCVPENETCVILNILYSCKSIAVKFSVISRWP